MTKKGVLYIAVLLSLLCSIEVYAGTAYVDGHNLVFSNEKEFSLLNYTYECDEEDNYIENTSLNITQCNADYKFGNVTKDEEGDNYVYRVPVKITLHHKIGITDDEKYENGYYYNCHYRLFSVFDEDTGLIAPNRDQHSSDSFNVEFTTRGNVIKINKTNKALVEKVYTNRNNEGDDERGKTESFYSIQKYIMTITVPKSLGNIGLFIRSQGPTEYRDLDYTISENKDIHLLDGEDGVQGTEDDRDPGYYKTYDLDSLVGMTTEEDDDRVSGKAGELSWEINDNELTIEGTGAIPDYSFSRTPWGSYIITKVVISDGVTGIGSGSFYGLTKLTDVEMPDGIQKIGDFAFWSCNSLKEIMIPDSVSELGEYAFCATDLKSVSIPGNVKYIGSNCFGSCSGLSSVTFNEGLLSLGDACFKDCVLLDRIELPDSLESIGESCFSCMAIGSEGVYRSGSKLKSVKFGTGLKSIGSQAFCNADSLEEISIPDSCNDIGYGAFSNCPVLGNVKLPTGLTAMPNNLFSDCISLKSVTIPSNVVSIGMSAFSRSGIETIYLPKSLKTIDSGAFYEASALKDVYYEGTESDWKSISIGNNNTFLQNAAIHYNSSYSGGSNNDISDAFSPSHSNDGSDVAAGTVSSGNAAWVFDPEKSTTVIVVKQIDISKKLESLTKAEGYDSTAKHRYSTDDKKKAKVDKKGILKPKKSGQVSISLEQKVKGGSWTKIGEPLILYIQMPEMQKKDEQSVSSGATIDAFMYLGRTTYRPNKWISSKPDVASIDENTGIITIHKKGTTKIIAEYGEGKNGSGKKYATKLKIRVSGE
ncbi:MAG: leucine-rich repeat domain-containing protein [Lachnospiraceae bacterium]|nr:leucine-rich repeat domain-containing protein [Lachnospiraceae bacterium]